MIHFKRLLFMFLVLAFAAGEVFGQSGQGRAGTSAAPELRIPVGGRYLAMNGAAVANAEGLEAIYWNPGGAYLTGSSNVSTLFSYRSYIADMNMLYAALGANFGNLGYVAVSFRNLDVGDINVTTLEQPDGTGATFNPAYFVMGLTYANKLSDRISVGVTFNLINESWTEVSATGFAFDMGVQYRDLFTPGFAIGVTVKNLGAPMKYDGTGLYVEADADDSERGSTFYKVSAAEFDLPSEVGLGVSYTREFSDMNVVTIAGSYVNNHYTFDDYKIGLEYSYANTLYVRGGYLYSPETDDDNMNIFSDYSFGFGLNLKHFANMDVSLDYAYVPVEYFDANNTFSLRFNF